MVFSVVAGCGAKHDGIRVSPLCCTGFPCKNNLSTEEHGSEEKASSWWPRRPECRRPCMTGVADLILTLYNVCYLETNCYMHQRGSVLSLCIYLVGRESRSRKVYHKRQCQIALLYTGRTVETLWVISTNIM